MTEYFIRSLPNAAKIHKTLNTYLEVGIIE